jgi:hypothetical protein
MSDYDFDDRCQDEQREGDMERAHERGCMASFGVPFDPYDDEEGAE